MDKDMEKLMYKIFDRVNQMDELTEDQKGDAIAAIELFTRFHNDAKFREALTQYVWERARSQVTEEVRDV